MIDRNSPEAIAERSAQEDPFVMYLVVKHSLGMGVGKVAAQCAHASQQLLLKYYDYKNHGHQSFGVPVTTCLVTGILIEDIVMTKRLDVFDRWLATSFRKVVLKANDSQFDRLKEEEHVVVVDAGLTEIAPGSETVIGLWPRRKSECSKLIQKLQVLK